MKHTDQDKASPRGEVPRGFLLESCGRAAFIIRYTPTGTDFLKAFTSVFLAGWTVGCAFVLQAYLGGSMMEDGRPMPIWFASLFWAAEGVIAYVLICLLFNKESFRIDQENLVIETYVLGRRRYRSIPRQSIKKLVQVKDGGGDEESRPSWGLTIEWDESASLISSQPHEKSLWLGRTLSGWAGVEFTEVPEE
jgi:hypothetical protein